MNIVKNNTNEENSVYAFLEELDNISLLLENDKYEGITIMTDYFSENLIVNEFQFAKKFNKILGELISYSQNKEAIIEQLPSQFRFTDEFKKKFLAILPVPESKILEIIREWNKYEINDRTVREIFLMCFPYVYLAMNMKSEELSMNILVMLNMFMYSISYSRFFPKYEYNRDKGQYIIQNILKNKSLGKYNSIYDLMLKTSGDTLRNYKDRLTDRKIYEATWSNIQKKMDYHMKEFHQAYQSVGSIYLTTNKDIISTSDREGNDTTVETSIENNSSLILRISKDVTGYVDNPAYIESSIMKHVLGKIMNIDLNAKRANNIEKKSLVERNVQSMIEEIQKTRDFETVISNILQNFLWVDNTTVRDIETPKFLDKIIYDLSYVGKNKIYINNITKILDKYIDIVLNDRGKSTSNVDNKTLQKYRKTIIYYFALLTQLVVKRS